MGTRFNTYSPALDLGKGFGDLPKSLNFAAAARHHRASSAKIFPASLGPTAVRTRTTSTGASRSSTACPTSTRTSAEIDNAFVKHLIPITEFVFSAPVSNWRRAGGARPERSSPA